MTPPCREVRDGKRNYLCKAVRRAKSPIDYASLPAVRGCTVKMILGKPCNDELELQANDTVTAIERLRRGFGFVGLVEEWDLSVCLFHRTFGMRPLPQEFTAVRVNRGAAILRQRKPALVAGIRDEFDEALYSAAAAIFRKRVRAALRMST